MKTRSFWSGKRAGFTLAFCLASSGLALGQNSVTTAYLHGKAPVAPDAITTLGPDLFGDKLNLFNGSFSFEQTDFELPGNSALRVALVRHNSPGRSEFVRGAMGDWDLNTPRVEGTFAIPEGWVSGYGTAATRCSGFWSPPDVTRGSVDFSPNNYWQGVNLVVPGHGSQEILTRRGGNALAPADGSSYPLVTKENWQIRCLPGLLNAPGEGFFALSPEGVRYTFNWMASRRQTDLQAGEQRLARQDMFLMATRVEDRFGNWVQYTYDSANPLRLLRIEANDGRVVTLAYTNGRVSSVFDGTRTWQYLYSSQGDLQFVVLPDASRWQFNLRPFVHAEPFLLNEYVADCDAFPNPQGLTGGVGTITHPSGAVGTFASTLFFNGRTNVDRVCYYAAGTDPADGWTTGSVYQRWTTNQGLYSKSISGPGMPTMTWTYANSGGVGEWAPCFACADRKTVTVTEPSGAKTRHTFGIRWRSNEGQLLRVEEGWDVSTALKTTDYRYREPAGDFADGFGNSPWLFSDWLSTRNRPQDQRIITQQGVYFVWEANPQPGAFDAYARPLLTRSWSSLGPSRSLSREYRDFTSQWVLGQTRRVVETVTGLEVERTEFHTPSGLPSQQYSFGRLTKRMEYYADGTLRQLIDPAGKATTFQNFHRGQPQRANFADGTFATQVVNNLGNASEHTNEAGTTTRFWFDSMGRVSKVIYPTGDDEPYCDTDQSFVQSWVADRGLPEGHWRQTITTCNARTERWFDGFWRVRLERRQDTTNPATTGSTVETRFDGGGRKAFQSYPLRDITQVNMVGDGTSYQYDELNRVVRTQASSELGLLTTITDYLPGFTKRVTNPRGHATIFRYQAFDQPSEDSIASISAPESVSVAIPRDVFGKPSAITRAGGGASATRSYVYDIHQRLCKTVEPETGATIQAYDAAGNVAWRASGQGNIGTGVCDQGSVGGGSKINFGYDTRNRLTTTTYGDGSPGISRTYTPDGLLQELRSSAFNVSWTYRYNNRRLLVRELYAWFDQPAGNVWNFTWGRDAYGNVRALTDPWGTMAYAPNALGEATQVSGYATDIRYHPNGAVAGYRLDNGITHSMAQNLRGLPATAADAGVTSEVLSYDANGNVTAIDDLQEGGANNRSMPWYDGLDRLRQANGPWGSATFAYDALDNLVASTVGGRVLSHYIDPATQLLRSMTGSQNIALDYDARGNLINRAGQAFVFDIGNRMASAQGKVSTYIYDGHGRRNVTVVPDGHWRLQTYTTDGKLRFGYATNPGQHTRYVYVGDKLVAETSEPATTYSHTDMLGSPLARTNSIGALLSRTRYEPYGATVAGSTNPTSIGFTGHVNDADMALVYMQQRYYDPVAGRFLSVDPVTTDSGNGALFNRYMYAANNPFTLIDPDGRCTGSHLTNSDGTCKSTGGFTTGTDGMAQGMAIQRAADNLATGGYGQLASQSAANGEGLKAAGYTLAGTAYGVANVLTLGQGARVVGLARSLWAGRAGAPTAAFHHTGTMYVDSILRSGLRPGSYATPTAGLSPLQAHIELALNPAGGARNAVLQIDLAGLRAAGYEIPSVSRVSGQFGMAGGGFEMRFPYAVPPEFIKAIPR